MLCDVSKREMGKIMGGVGNPILVENHRTNFACPGLCPFFFFFFFPFLSFFFSFSFAHAK